MEKIRPENTTLALCGIGYVGYPVALLFASKGFRVVGVDVDEKRVEAVNSGEMLIKGKEPGLADLVDEVRHLGTFTATTDSKSFKNADFIIVAVQTPVGDQDRKPAYTHLRSALEAIGTYMKKGVTVIIESTVAPGTTKGIVVPVLEKTSGMRAGEDFFVVHCPERLMPGHLLENIREYNRVIGGISAESSARARLLYQHIVEGELDETDVTTAEVVKTGENTYRDVQIAFANEMALVCEELGANVWKVRELINKCRKVTDTRPEALRQMHYPGAGVGGHCIPKDSWLLLTNVSGSKTHPRLIPTARAVNDSMPSHMFELLKDALEEASVPLKDATVVVLGYAYDGNSDDDRNTPAQPFIELLEENQVSYVVHDPYIEKYTADLDDVLRDAHALVLITAHDLYKDLTGEKMRELMKGDHPVIVDGRNVFDGNALRKQSFVYRGIGNIS